jgi:hypothetical protein
MDLFDLIVVPPLNGGWQHNYSIKTREAGHANEQCINSLMFIGVTQIERILSVMHPHPHPQGGQSKGMI